MPKFISFKHLNICESSNAPAKVSTASASWLQSDKVLQSTIASLKELETRCNTTAEQGDLLATAIDDLDSRFSAVHKALMHTQGSSSMRHRDPSGSSSLHKEPRQGDHRAETVL
jgi:hypothetical protein